jgi:AcrR family transcriptional regulator
MPTTTSSSSVERRGRPRGRRRDPALDDVILATTLQVLAEVGYEGFTVNEVIARSRVSSATVYRRWPSVDDLVVAALETLSPEAVEIDSGSLDGDVGELIRELGAVLAEHGHLSGPGTLGSASNGPFGAMVDELFVKPRREALGKILRRAKQRGELARVPPVSDCWSYLAGPVHHRVLIRRERFTTAFATATTTYVTAGLRALGGHGPSGSDRGRLV